MMAQVVVQKATADVYAALIENKVCVKVGYGNWSPGDSGVQVRPGCWIPYAGIPCF